MTDIPIKMAIHLPPEDGSPLALSFVGNAWGDDLLLQYHEGPMTFTFNPDNSAEVAHQRLIERMKATSLSLRTFADNPRDLPRIQYRGTVDATVF